MSVLGVAQRWRESLASVSQEYLTECALNAKRSLGSTMESKPRVIMAKEVNIRDVIADGALIGVSAALLWHFSNIWRYGQHLVGEPNITVRSLETAILIAILVFGVSKFIGTLRAKRKGK